MCQPFGLFELPMGSATGGYHHRQRVCQPFRLKSTTKHFMYMALNLQSFDAHGFKSEGIWGAWL